MLRLVKLQIPEIEHAELEEALEEANFVRVWTDTNDGKTQVQILVAIEESERLISLLQEKFGDEPEFRLIILPVEATVPHMEDDDEEEEEEDGEEADEEDESEDEGPEPPISVEELRDDITSGMHIDGTFVAVAILSTLVAAVGILRNDVTIVIAAMILAPLLKPNMALSLATTLADLDLARSASRVNAAGLAISFVISVGFGAVLPIDPTVEQIALRTKAGVLELILAGSAGAAGALSFTTSSAGAVVGVMVAVALLPPIVVCGMLLGAGYQQLAVGAAYLSAANIVCLNLAGVVTFFAQGIAPRTAWETKRAERAFWWAVLFWLALLVILVAIIVFGETYRRYP
jgi:uncharacterized hydrophobic protein (TIGR00341 family)